MLTENARLYEPSDVFYFNFSRAFDKVPHERLLAKIEAYGFNNELLKWLREFLTNRLQRVVMGTNKSTWQDVLSGVPQGSVLGPLCFILYINDVPDVVKNICKLYADDTKLMNRAPAVNGTSSIQDDLDALSRWSKDWLMLFNYNKCHVMHFGKNNASHTYHLTEHTEGGKIEHAISAAVEERYLSIMMSSDQASRIRENESNEHAAFNKKHVQIYGRRTCQKIICQVHKATR